jgi:PAS domain S-box-containing protein
MDHPTLDLEERFRILADSAPVLIWKSGPDALCTFVNQPWLDFRGRTLEEEQGQGWTEGLHPDDAQRCLTTYLAAFEARRPFVMEYRLRRADGAYRWVLDTGAPRFVDDEFAGFLSVCIDITDRKEAEVRATQRNRELQQRVDELQALLDLLPIGVAIASDPECRHIRVNSAGARLLELHQGANASLTGPEGEKPTFKVYRDGKELAPEELPMQQAASRGIPLLNQELTLVFPEGRLIQEVCSAVPLFDEQGRGRGCVAALVDITERKRLEEELRRRAELLAETDRHKDEFLATLGHELRNPLAPIRNALQVLGLRQDSESVTWAQDLINRQVAHLTRLVDDLLDSSRIGRGKVLLKRQRLDLVQVVHAVVDDQRSLLEGNGLKVEFVRPPEAVWVGGDPTRLAQVVGNLLLNAGKFTDLGGRVTVSVGHDSQGQPAVTVRDTGIGMEPDLLPHVFETFTQADRSISRSRGGLGLGLGLARALVELHGGQIRAASAGPGCGSEFSFWLPPARTDTSPNPAPANTDSPARHLRILLIEDNRDAARSLQLVLELYGHTVVCAHNGLDGVELARRFRADVILCDLGLPGMDGFEVARTLGQEGPGTRPYLVAVSGYGSEADQRRCIKAGFDRHLTKPVDPSDLKELFAHLPRVPRKEPLVTSP